MKSYDKLFMVTWITAFLMLSGIVVENIHSTLLSQATIKIDVKKVKEEIKKAGLEPYDARYWEKLYKDTK